MTGARRGQREERLAVAHSSEIQSVRTNGNNNPNMSQSEYRRVLEITPRLCIPPCGRCDGVAKSVVKIELGIPFEGWQGGLKTHLRHETS